MKVGMLKGDKKMVMPKLDLTEAERKERTKRLHAENARKRAEKKRLWAYKMLVKAIVGQLGIKDANIDEIALKIAKNGQFRVFMGKTAQNTEKSPKKAEK